MHAHASGRKARKARPWNRCDVCGRFIPMDDFSIGMATRHLVTLDTQFSSEAYETLCREHRKDDE